MAKIYVKNTDGTYTPQSSVLVSNLDIVQDKGDSLISAMSQKAVTDELKSKQDTISDLDAIRQGAEKGSTALQTESDPIYTADKPNLALKSELDGKVDKEDGKVLSSNDYTDAEKAKLTELDGEIIKIYNSDILISGGYIDATSGDVISSPYTRYTPFIDVRNANLILADIVGSTSSMNFGSAWYDEQYNLISTISKHAVFGKLILEVPKNACYFRTTALLNGDWELEIYRIKKTLSSLLDDLKYSFRVVTTTPHQNLQMSSYGSITFAQSNYVIISFPVRKGALYTLNLWGGNLIRYAFSFDDVPTIGKAAYECVSLLNTNSTQFVSKIDGYCFVFQNFDNQFNAFYNITESIVGFNSIIYNEEKIQGSSLDTDEQIKKGLVAANGKLTKSGLFVTNSSGKKIELRGVGLHYLLQYKNLHNWQLFNTLKNYGVNLIRISTYLHDIIPQKSDGELAKGYLSSKVETIAEIEKIIKICVDLGMYCIIDWHNLDDNIMTYKDDAIEFFDYFSKKYGDIPNILYEVSNEPYNDSASTVAAYVNELRKTILANTTNPIIITGVGMAEKADDTFATRSLALKNELSAIGITDVFISPHFYGYNFSTIIESCLQNDIPLFISEWGNSDSNGDGQFHDNESTLSMRKIHEECIPNAVWKLTDQAMTSSLLSNHGFINSYRYQYGFTFEDLSRNGMLILGLFRQFATNMYIERT